jgi:cleavage and polyadenylation specificity factor subunit 2
MKAKVFLEGAELEAHYQAEREAGELEAKHQALLERSRRLAQADADDDSESDSDDDSIAEEEGTTGIEGGGDEIRQTIRRRVGAFTGGAGAWDEFLDPTKLEGTGGQSFDIYVKGSYSKRVAGETRDGLQRFRMFPVVERKRRVDAYGEAIDVEGWLRRGMDDEDAKDVRSGAGAAVQVIGKRSREEEAEIAEVSFVSIFQVVTRLD